MTPRVFATEELRGSRNDALEAVESSPMSAEPVIGTPFNAVEKELPEQEFPEPDLASTEEELLAWLEAHKNREGTLKLTADIYFDDLEYQYGRCV